MKKIINIGIIGCGEIAQIMHIPYIVELEGLHLHSLCNSSIEPMEFIAEKYGIPAERCYKDYREMMQDPDLDAVAICTNDHYDPAMVAISFKKHVFVEKPLAFNTRQAEEIIKAAKKNNIIVQVGYMKPYDPGFEYFLNRFRQLNVVSHIRMHNFAGDYTFIPRIYDLCKISHTSPEERKRRAKEQDDAVIEEIGTNEPHYMKAYMNMLLGTTHDSVLLREMLGDDISVYSASIDNNGQIIAILQSRDFRFTWESHFITKRMKWDENMYVYSPECELSLHFPSPYLKNAVTKVHINENESERGANRDIEVTASFDESYKREWREFRDCVLTLKQPKTDAEGGLLDIALASKIIKKAMELESLKGDK